MELEAVFRQRYEVYEQCRMHSFLQPNEARIDIDAFDVHSVHFGLFNNEEVVAYLRVVLHRAVCFNQEVALLATQYGLMKQDVHVLGGDVVSPLASFPFLAYEGVPEGIGLFYGEKSKQNAFCEASRLIIQPQYRSIRMAVRMIECAMVAGMQLFGDKGGIAMLDCFTSHLPVYSMFGFKPVPGVEPYTVPQSPLKGITLWLPLSPQLSFTGIPESLHEKMQLLINKYKANLQIELEF